MAFRSFGKQKMSRTSRKLRRKSSKKLRRRKSCKAGKFGKTSRRIRKTMDSLVLKRKKIKGRRHSKCRSFGKIMGPGFAGQTSYSNAYSPYFGSSVPFQNASNWWYPYTGGEMQSPQMLMKNPN